MDGSLSPYRRRLVQEDLAAGLSFRSPEHVLISIELISAGPKLGEERIEYDSTECEVKWVLSFVLVAVDPVVDTQAIGGDVKRFHLSRWLAAFGLMRS